MYFPDHFQPLIRQYIRTVQTRPVDRDSFYEIMPLLFNLFSSNYASLFLLPNRFAPDIFMASNNPEEFVSAYIPLVEKDFLLNNIVETTGLTRLTAFSPEFLAENDEFCTAVQNARPVSDVLYAPLEINGYLAGYFGVARAGRLNLDPGYSRNEIQLFNWLARFLNVGYSRTLEGEPASGTRALLDAGGRVLQRGAEIDAAFGELFGDGAREAPSSGRSLRCCRFAEWYRNNLLGTGCAADLLLRAHGKTYRLAFRRLDSTGFRLYFPREPQAEVVLRDPQSGPSCGEFLRADEHRFTYDLTPREEEVVRCIYRGLSNREIGRQLNISPGTVKQHLNRIFEKTGARSRTQLVMRLSSM